jgi:hypothetical protein
MPEIGTSGSMSGDGKRSDAEWPQATAPVLDSTIAALDKCGGMSAVGETGHAAHEGVVRP